MSSSWGVRTLVVMCLVAALAGGLPSGSATADVATQPGGYVGSLVLPPGSRPEPASLADDASSCPGCVWTLEPACQRPDPDGQVMCSGSAFSCPAPQQRLALWLLRPGDAAPRMVGTLCLDPAVALQPAALVPGVRDRFARLVPALRPSYQPSRRGLVNLPVVFAAGQPTTIGRPVFALVGRRIELTATVSWRWDFGDGVSLVVRTPGGPWPDTDVAHAYAAPGTYTVRVTARWEGEFKVDGAGPFQVTGPSVTQLVALPLRVVPARSVLVGGPS